MKFGLYFILLLILLLFGRSILLDKNLEISSNKAVNNETGIFDFVPDRWDVEQQITGNINNDSIDDVILSVIETATDTEGAIPKDRKRKFLALSGQKQGGYKLLATSDTVLPCSTCLGMMGSFGNNTPIIILDNGIIEIGWISGSRETNEITLDFRFDAALEKIMLIKEHVLKRDRVNGQEFSKLVNLINGIEVLNGVKRSIPKKQISIENVSFNSYL